MISAGLSPLSKEIGEQGAVAMMVMIEARKIVRLFASTASDQEAAEAELFPIATNVLTALVASQLSTSATKERYRVDEVMQQSKAAIDDAVARYRREEAAKQTEQRDNAWARQ